MANLFIQRVDKESLQLILKRNGASIGKNCDIESGLIFHNCLDYSNLSVGFNCHIGKNCFFDLKDKVEIRNNVVISMQVTFVTHIDMSKSPLSLKFPITSDPIIINDGVYIGANSTILKGVVLDKNCFVAAGSLVNDYVKPATMVGGIPARIIKEI
ncbi:MAG: acyltransferase [Bacteroidales bacterium]|nr:acyltransferase [Bacteroidales bacterium]